MDGKIAEAPVEGLEREIRRLEQQISRSVDAKEIRLLKRRLKKAQYMMLLQLGKLG